MTRCIQYVIWLLVVRPHDKLLNVLSETEITDNRQRKIMTRKVIVNCFHVNRKGHLHRLHTFSLLITERSTQLIQMMSAVVMRAA